MIIRKFLPEDLDAVLKLFYEVVHSIGAKYYNEEQVNAWAPQERTDKEEWLKALTTNISYVAEDKGEIVGFADMTPTGYIERVYMHQSYQGKTSALYRKLEEVAREMGLHELTTIANVMAKPIAEKKGFEVVEKQLRVCRGVEFTTYLMRKKL